MAVVTSAATPDWMAKLRSKNKDKKDDVLGGSAAAKTESEARAKPTAAWMQKRDSSKSVGRSSPSSRRTLFGEPASKQNGSPVLSRLSSSSKQQPVEKTNHQASTLPRSFGSSTPNGSTNAAGRPGEAQSSTRGTSTLTRDAGKAGDGEAKKTPSSGSGNKSSVSVLRNLFSQKTADKPAPGSPVLLSARLRADATSSPKLSKTSKPETSGTSKVVDGSRSSECSTAAPHTKPELKVTDSLDLPSSNVLRLRRISEERDRDAAAALQAKAAGAKRKTSNEERQTEVGKVQRKTSNEGKPPSPSTKQATKHGNNTPQQPPKVVMQVEGSPNEPLESTNIDDFIADKEMLRTFSLDPAKLRKLSAEGASSAPASATGSPASRRQRRHSILLTPERKTAKKMRRRVSFSEVSLEVVHQFQREEPQPSDDEDDEDTRNMIKRAMVMDDADGLATELHPRLSPLGAGRAPKKNKSLSGPFAFPADEDEPPDMYTDVPDSVAALLM
ncbi:serine/arginine repetitive matrix protein 2-like [Sycon ciliatum]|uniref:serine/arginine repetitive matrix protein 2-like n=1 Tax=Sycon ciliatum TaxID=27933 RepID=UPI0031F65B3C